MPVVWKKWQPPSEWVSLSNEAARVFECGINETKFDNEVNILTIIHATSNKTYQAQRFLFATCGVDMWKNCLQTHVCMKC